MTTQRYVWKHGPLTLGQLLGSGGQGKVYEVRENARLAVKIYSHPIAQGDIERLEALCSMGNERLRRLCAWPHGLVRTGQGMVVGFVMDRLDHPQQVFDLYNPQRRVQCFPDASYSFLAHTATNIARAFAAVHDAGVVVGDINQRNITVGPAGVVHLLDCDSFQIRGGSRTWRCPVGVPEFTPPELQSVSSFRDVDRTSNHDCFGLAVMLFYVLMLGRHPFMGVSSREDLDLPEAIRIRLFAYGPPGADRGVRPPPHALPIEALGPELRQLFNAAFGAESHLRRPSAREWVAALQRFQSSLVTCKRNKLHQYPRTSRSCPLCELAERSPDSFPALSVGASPADALSSTGSSSGTLSYPTFPPIPGMPAEVATLLSPQSTSSRVMKAATLTEHFLGYLHMAAVPAILGGCASQNDDLLLAGISGGLVLFPIRRGVTALFSRLPAMKNAHARKRLHEAYQAAVTERDKVGAKLKVEFSRLQLEYQRHADRLARWTHEEQRALRKLQENRETLQRDQFLSRFTIANGSIPGVGAQLKSRLYLRGVICAADVTFARVKGIEGIGEVRARALVDWRRALERRFTFNPANPIDPNLVVRARAALARERAEVQHALAKAVLGGRNVVTQMNTYNSGFISHVRSLVTEHEQLCV